MTKKQRNRIETVAAIVVLATLASVVIIAAVAGNVGGISLLPFGILSLIGCLRHIYRLQRLTSHRGQ